MIDTALVDHALSYLKRGWSVIPVNGKKAVFPWRTYQLRLPTEIEIRKWWHGEDFNIGIICGQVSGLVVLDIDGEEGVEAIKALVPPDYEWNTPVAVTGRGWHYYFKYPSFELRSNLKICHKVDLKADGGYVVAPPSVHPGNSDLDIPPGKLYQWSVSPDDAEIADLPDWLTALAIEQIPPDFITPPPSNIDPGQYANYVRAALAKELEILATCNGNRNSQLNESAFNLGRIVAKGLLDRAVVETELYNVARSIGLEDVETKKTIQSGLGKGEIAPWELPRLNGKRKKSGASPSPDGGIPPKPPTVNASDENHPGKQTPSVINESGEYSLSDLGNAKRLVAGYGDNIRYVYGMDRWLLWDGTRWARDDRGGIYRAAKTTVISMYEEAKTIENNKARRNFVKFVLQSEARSRLEAMIALAQSEDKVAIRAQDLNPDHWLLNCRNGTVDLRTLELKSHEQQDMITKRVEIDFDPTAEAPIWHDFLLRILSDDYELYRFVQRAIGYTLTGDVSEQCLFFMFGNGKNGKSTFIETLSALLGDYATKTPTETIMMRDKNAASNDLARLAGQRLVVAKEVEEGARLAEAVVKDLTGGDTQVARFLYKEFIEFKPTHKLWMYGNHKPVVRGTDEGIWRRIRLVPFTVTVPPEERDPDLPEKLLNELPGILNWALVGCREWKRHGLGTAKAVDRATESYRSEMDVLLEFLTECFDRGPNLRVSAGLLYEQYKSWCEQNGERSLSQRQLGIRLKERGFNDHKGTGGRREWLGLCPIAKERPIY